MKNDDFLFSKEIRNVTVRKRKKLEKCQETTDVLTPNEGILHLTADGKMHFSVNKTPKKFSRRDFLSVSATTDENSSRFILVFYSQNGSEKVTKRGFLTIEFEVPVIEEMPLLRLLKWLAYDKQNDKTLINMQQLDAILTGELVTAQKRYFIIVNPVGGSGNAKSILQNNVLPFFELCGIETEVKFTEYFQHAMEISQHLQSDFKSLYDAIVIVGGDGVLSEVIHGFMKREDWKMALEISFAMIPGGSGNGLCTSVLSKSSEPFSISSACFVAAKGMPHGLDVASIKGNNGSRSYCLLSMAWGLIADIDVDSEKLRMFGGSRFLIQAVLKVFSTKTWKGKFAYLANTDHESEGECPALYWDMNSRSAHNEKDGPACYFDYNSDTDKKKWITLEGEFGMIWGMNVSHASSDSHVGPGAKLDDGLMHLTVINVNQAQTKTVFNYPKRIVKKAIWLSDTTEGKHDENTDIQYIHTRAFYLEPKGTDDRICIDGELFDCCGLQVEVHRSMAQVICL